MTFKKNLSISIVLVSMLFFSSSGFAVDVTVNARAEIQDATLTLTAATSLNFGQIIMTTPGTVRIDASGGALSGGTPTAVSPGLSSSGATSGSFTIESNVTADVSIAYPSPNPQIKKTPATTTATQIMTITDISTNSSATSATITAGTATTVHVGGIITLITSQETGTYSGSMTISVNYI